MSRFSPTLLSIRKLVVQYARAGGRKAPLIAVRGVSLDIGTGEIFGLVGESGSGKTSLALSILQLVPVFSGAVLYRDQDLATAEAQALRTARKSIQMIFQDPLAALSPRRTIQQSLLEPLAHFGIGKPAERLEQAIAALEHVGLDPALQGRYPHELSGGQRQRAALARALVSEPELIIADEPIASLDVSAQARIVDLMLDLRERLGVAFLFVSHDLAVVRQVADTVGVMYLGTQVESASADDLFEQPAHPYTRSLLSAVAVPDPGQPAPLVTAGEPGSVLTPPAGCVFHTRCPDRMPSCASIEPAETWPQGLAVANSQTAQYAHGEAATLQRKVKCHLWNT
ncbi:MAG: ABC transporter ATP-binding protein [Xanthomonadales bacterium]|nr:ABC transporter ATP-binding protein [Xanthomonadales bacterium]